MEKPAETLKRNSDEFFAVVSALTRFVETADNDLEPKDSAKQNSKNEGANKDGSES